MNAKPTKHVLRVRILPQSEASTESLPLHLAIALDTSASMDGEKLECAVATCKAILFQLRATDRISIAQFSNQVTPLLQNVSGSEAQLAVQPLTNLIADGVTCTDRVLTWLQTALPPEPGVVRVAILITDGQPTTAQGRIIKDLTPLFNQADALTSTGIVLYTVGYGNPLDFNTAFLMELSHRGHGAFLYAATPEALKPKLQQWLTFCQTVVVESALLKLELSAGATLEGMCRLQPDYLPLELNNNGEVVLEHLRQDTPTDILIEIEVPILDFGERLTTKLIATVQLKAGSNSSITAHSQIEYANSYQKSQRLNDDVNHDRNLWEMHRYRTELLSTNDPSRATQLLTDIQTAALNAGQTDLAEQAAKSRQNLQQTGKLSPDYATALLQEYRNAGETDRTNR
ncbi:MAG: VWA domain-containing protein [Xenococcaceae cyanobacterium]